MLTAGAGAAVGPPRVSSVQVSFYPLDPQHHGARIDPTVTGAKSVSLVLQTATVANRAKACTPDAWKLLRPAGALRMHRVGPSRWEVHVTHNQRVFKVLDAEIQLFHFTAHNPAGATHVTFTRDACTG
jgi:hypothetical protein